MKKMFVVISTYLKSLEEINEKRGDHLAFINNYVLAGKFIMLGRKNPVDGAVIIAHNVTREELEDIFKSDPYFVNGLAKYNITEFSPASYAIGIEEAIEKL
jgi:YCII-like protein